jgi:hypothetical protein
LRRFVPQKPRLSESREPLVANFCFDVSLRGKKSTNRRFLGILCAKRNKYTAKPTGFHVTFTAGCSVVSTLVIQLLQ